MSSSLSPRRISLTTWALIALVGGLALGVFGHAYPARAFDVLRDLVRPLGALWVAGLRLTVLPLIAAGVLAAITSPRDSEAMAKLGARAIVLFVLFILAASGFAMLFAPSLLSLYKVDPATVAALHASTVVPDAVRTAAQQTGGTPGEWLGRLLPSNLFEALVAGDILGILLFTIIFGLAVTRLPAEQRALVAGLADAVSNALIQCVRWLLVVAPIGAFAIMFAIGLTAGGDAIGLLMFFVAGQCALMATFTLLLYPLAAAAGRVPLRTFAKALIPAQIVAITTRSSLAALPALVEGARDTLRLPPIATTFVLPLSASLFRLHRGIYTTWVLFFLAYVYGVALTPLSVATFVITQVVVSFSVIGLPSNTTAFRSVPAYIAAGVPVEGLVYLEPMDTIPDYFNTLCNVTGMMTVATVLSRSSTDAHPQRAPSPSPVSVGEIA